MQKPLTEDELERIPHISPEDRARIEEALDDLCGTTEKPAKVEAIRAFLAEPFLTNDIDDSETAKSVREDLAFSAACFSDGWEACLIFWKPEG